MKDYQVAAIIAANIKIANDSLPLPRFEVTSEAALEQAFDWVFSARNRKMKARVELEALKAQLRRERMARKS
jgi:hypothetical protein